MAARAPKSEPRSADPAPAKVARASRKAADAPPSARAVAARLKALQKASAAAAPVVKPALTPAERVAAARAALSWSALRTHGLQLRGQAQASGFRAAGVLVTVGIGWIIGANTFDAQAPSPKVVEAIAALTTRLDEVETIAKRAQGQDVAGLRATVATLQTNLETSRSQTNTAIIEFSAKVEAMNRDSAARMLYAARDNASRFEKLDRDFTARLVEVDRFVVRTNERVQKLELRTDSAAPSPVSLFPALSPRTATTPPAPVPPLRPAADISPLPPETTRVAATPRTANPNRIPPNGYVLRDVRDGFALVEGRSGLRHVTMGDAIPGAGTVRAIEKRGREWVVVTSIGVIDGKGY